MSFCIWENIRGCECYPTFCQLHPGGDYKACPIKLTHIDTTSVTVEQLFSSVIDEANHGPYSNSDFSLEEGEAETVTYIPVSTGTPTTLTHNVNRSIWFLTPDGGYSSIHSMSYTGRDQPPPIISIYDPNTGDLEANFCEYDNARYGMYPYEQDHCKIFTSGLKLIRIVGVNTNFSIRLSTITS